MPDCSEENMKRLQDELKLCINELCLRCGAYKGRHQGACDHCRWKDQDAVLYGPEFAEEKNDGSR
jgi:ribosomal protein L32